MSKVKISIVLPIYNVEMYIVRSLDSILSQTMPQQDIEVILVDDGSEDSSGAICDRYVDQHGNFFVIHQRNTGVAAARNAGLLCASGEYIAFVDPDDYLEPRYCELSYAEAIRSGADIVVVDAWKENETVKIQNLSHGSQNAVTNSAKDITSLRCKILYPYMKAYLGSERFDSDVPLAATWDKLYSKAFLDMYGLQFLSELRVLDDMCFNFVAFEKARNVAYLHKPLYHYQVRKTSITNSYKVDRAKQDIKVFESILKEIKGGAFDNKLMQAYYGRIIKSFAICCRLCFFNNDNPADIKMKLDTVRDYMINEPYMTAFKKIRLHNLEWRLKAVALVGRTKMPLLMRLLTYLTELSH